jgi:hypothetical protein
MPASYIGGKIPKLIVRDLCTVCISEYFEIFLRKKSMRDKILCPSEWGASTIATGLFNHLLNTKQEGQ